MADIRRITKKPPKYSADYSPVPVSDGFWISVSGNKAAAINKVRLASWKNTIMILMIIAYNIKLSIVKFLVILNFFFLNL